MWDFPYLTHRAVALRKSHDCASRTKRHAVMAFTAVLPLIATACATAGDAAQRAPTTVPAFIIERETRVCASVQVDADLGTPYARDGSDPNLSLAMAAALNRASP